MELTKQRYEFIQRGMNLKELSRRYGVNYATLQRAAKREDWRGAREKWLRENKDQDPALEQRIDTIADKLLDQIERATEQLTIVTTLTRTKEKTESGERTVEQRIFENGAKVDVKELKDLVAALKAIRELRIPSSSLDIREQEAKIRNLERQLEAQGAAVITITMDGDTGEFAK